MLRSALVIATLLFAHAPTAQADFLEGDFIRVFAAGDIGVGGTISSEGYDVDLSPSFGFVGGADVGVLDFLALGARVDWMSVKPSDDAIDDFNMAAGMIGMNAAMGGMVEAGGAVGAVTDNRSTILDIAAYPRLRLPLPIIEPYVMVPVGYATFTPPEGDSESGMSLGVTGGVGLTMFPFLKLIGEAGYQMYYLENADVSEMRFRLGLALGF